MDLDLRTRTACGIETWCCRSPAKCFRWLPELNPNGVHHIEAVLQKVSG